MNSTLHGATAEYIEAVREALADQPASEVEEVIDDITEHLEQIIAELGGEPRREDLERRIGTPAAYAAELRTAAGLSEPGATPRLRGRWRYVALGFVVTWLLRLGSAFAVIGSVVMLADGRPIEAVAAYLFGLAPCVVAIGLWLLAHRAEDPVAAIRQLPDAARLESGVAALRTRPLGAEAVEFVESLRPAWWLLRGWLATQLMLLTVYGQVPLFPIDPSPLALVLLGATVVASVWWGRRTVAGLPHGWPRRPLDVGNIALVAAAPAVFFLMAPDESEIYSYENRVPQFEGFYHPDGTEIVNLYVYDQDGELVEGARLYDQDGRPVENVAPWISADCTHEGGFYPGGPQGNVYPRPAGYYDGAEGRCVDPGSEAPFGPALPGSMAEEQVADEGFGTGLSTVPPGAH